MWPRTARHTRGTTENYMDASRLQRASCYGLTCLPSRTFRPVATFHASNLLFHDWFNVAAYPALTPFQLRSYARSRASMAQTVRAIVLANATTTTLPGLCLSSSATQSPGGLERVSTLRAP